ncbi:MAG: MFS transporter [Actinomycetes bacterium]|jgi:MFS family permease
MSERKESLKSPAKLPRSVRLLLLGVLLSAMGNGLVFSFLFIYLHQVREIPSAIVGLISGYGALVGLVLAPVVGSLIDHWGPKSILLGSLIVSAVGFYNMGSIHSLYSALVVTTICSFGQAAMWPSQSAIAAEITTEEQRPKYYGSQFALLNLGMGLGGLTASLVVNTVNPQTFVNLYRGDGISYIVYFLVILFIRGVGHRTSAEREVNSNRTDGWKNVFADRVFVKVWLISIGAILCGYAQLEVGFTAFSSMIAKVQPSDIAWAFAANTLLIASAQLWFVKKLENFDRTKSIAIAALFWAAAWIALACAGIIRTQALALIIICQVVFGIGEMIWSPIMPSIVNQLAPEHLRGRYNAASTSTWTIGTIMGPVIAGTLLGAQLQWYWIGGLVAGLLIVAFAAVRLRLPNRSL